MDLPDHFDAGLYAIGSIRSPFKSLADCPLRPNPIGLAMVELSSVEGPVLRVRNIDCRGGTPLIDTKPTFASTDSVSHARRP